MNKIEYISENYPEALIMDDYDDCIAGVVYRFGAEPIVCYDKKLILDKLKKDGMTEEEAIEWFEFNQIGSWLGKMTPCFITKLD